MDQRERSSAAALHASDVHRIVRTRRACDNGGCGGFRRAARMSRSDRATAVGELGCKYNHKFVQEDRVELLPLLIGRGDCGCIRFGCRARYIEQFNGKVCSGLGTSGGWALSRRGKGSLGKTRAIPILKPWVIRNDQLTTLHL